MAERLSTGHVDAVNQTGSVKAVYANFVIHIFGGGSQPATADAAETGTLIMILTKDGGEFTSGSATNGLNFGTSTGGVLAKSASEEWKGTGLEAAGTGMVATHFRAYANTVVTGISTTAVRFDGQVGNSSSYEIHMTNTTIVEGGVAVVNSFNFTSPKQ